MQAIHVKYFGPTNTKGSRIKAFCERGSITIPYPHELSGLDCYWEAASRLIEKFCDEAKKEYGTQIDKNPWNGNWEGGQLPSGDYCFVKGGK